MKKINKRPTLRNNRSGILVDTQVGYLAECFVMYELSKKGIYCTKLGIEHDFDLITDTGDKIEVKSSRVQIGYPGRDYKQQKFMHPHKTYSFNNMAKKNYKANPDVKGKYIHKMYARDRMCDFFIFVCLNEDLSTHKTYVIPKKDFGIKTTLSIPLERKRPIRKGSFNSEQYLERWDLLTQDKKYEIKSSELTSKRSEDKK